MSKEKDIPDKSEDILPLNGSIAQNRKKKRSTNEAKSKVETYKEKMNQKLHPKKLQSRVWRDQEIEVLKKEIQRYGGLKRKI